LFVDISFLFIYSSDQSAMNQLNLEISKPSTRQELASRIGRSKVNEKLHDLTPNGGLLDVSPKEKILTLTWPRDVNTNRYD